MDQKTADVWKKDVWDFQAFSQTFLELRFSLGNDGKGGRNLNSQTWPGTPRRPSPRHPQPPEWKIGMLMCHPVTSQPLVSWRKKHVPDVYVPFLAPKRFFFCEGGKISIIGVVRALVAIMNFVPNPCKNL